MGEYNVLEKKIDTVLLEYETIRGELIDQVKNQLQIYSLSLAGLSLLFSYILIDKKFEALLISSLIIFVLGFRWMWDIEMSVLYSSYLREIASIKLPKLIGYLDQNNTKEKVDYYLVNVLGWQHYHDDLGNWRSRGWAYSVLTLFGIPLIFSWIYFGFVLKSLFDAGTLNLITDYPNLYYLLEFIFIPIFGGYIYRSLKKSKKKNNESINRSRTILSAHEVNVSSIDS